MLERIRSVLARHGLLGTCVLAVRTIGEVIRLNSPKRRREWRQQLAFDRKYGIETAIKVPASALRVPDSKSAAALHAVGYQSCSIPASQVILRGIPCRHEDFTFIDIGAGKGRAVLLASHLPWRRIIGVELSPHVAEIAQRNIARYRDPDQKCRDIDVVAGDATKFPLPEDGNLVLYLYNPFGEPIMRAFLENVRHAGARGGREVWIVYVEPQLQALLDSMPYLAPVPNQAGLCIRRVTKGGELITKL